jgi:hypothetical protein
VLLKNVANYPFKKHDWIDNRFVIHDMGPVGALQRGVLLLRFGNMLYEYGNDKPVSLYCCVPLYSDEAEYFWYVNRYETDQQRRQEICERLAKILPLIVDLSRPSVCPRNKDDLEISKEQECKAEEIKNDGAIDGK